MARGLDAGETAAAVIFPVLLVSCIVGFCYPQIRYKWVETQGQPVRARLVGFFISHPSTGGGGGGGTNAGDGSAAVEAARSNWVGCDTRAQPAPGFECRMLALTRCLLSRIIEFSLLRVGPSSRVADRTRCIV
jgi:hypothetical protein